MKKVVLFCLLVLSIVGKANAQSKTPKDTTCNPSGKIGIKVYADYHAIFSKINGANDKMQRKTTSGFEVTRAYFGYSYHFSNKWSGNVKLDVGRDANLSAYTAYLKNAGLSWKATNQLTLNFGLIDTRAFHFQENFWGKRYLYKSFQDQYHFNSSADAGLVVQYQFSKLLKADVSIFNGEGYKKLQDPNGQFQYAAGLTINPIKGLYARVYADYSSIASTDSNTIANKNTIAAFVGYKMGKFSIGAEYNLQNNFRSLNNHLLRGISFYGEYWVNKTIGIFARYDRLTSNRINRNDAKKWNVGSGKNGNDGSIIIAGLEAKPINGVTLSLNYREWTAVASEAYPVHSVNFNVQYAL